MKQNVVLTLLILLLTPWLAACGSTEPPPDFQGTVAAAVAEDLGWDAARIDREVQHTLARLAIPKE